ncbi:Saccharopine dehydrogenase-domain-containing protein [Xylariales sp. PMI_506]|nr:Saccharopine dehydrogenase-domain-containing protein [Xylariales sp. PMI_506]
MTSTEYDILLLGATGYTGRLTAEHIVEQLPTNLKWAIGGRSQRKLEVLRTRLQELAPNRLPPALETVSIDDPTQVQKVVRKTKVCISVVSYKSVGTIVVEACLKARIDYIDCAGVTRLNKEWIASYHERAVAAGVALVFACGALSAAQDLVTWKAVRELEAATGLKTRAVVLAIRPFTLSPSGGTIDSLMAEKTVDPKIVAELSNPWVLSPIQGSDPAPETGGALGLHRDPDLGLLSDSSFSSEQNRAVVYRTWGLLSGSDEGYGPRFTYSEYDTASSVAAGLFKILNARITDMLLYFAPLRAAARVFFPAQGDGADPEKSKKEKIEIEAVAVADGSGGGGGQEPKYRVDFSFPGDPYHLTGATLAHGAASLLYTRKLGGGFRGGCLTPAILGADLINRLQGAGAGLSGRVL